MFTFILFFLLTTSFNLQASQPSISFKEGELQEIQKIQEVLASIISQEREATKIRQDQEATNARSGPAYGLRTRKRKAPTPPAFDSSDNDDDDDDDYNPGQDRRLGHERPAKKPRKKSPVHFSHPVLPCNQTTVLTTPQQVSAAATAAAAPPALLEAQATTMMNTISPKGGSAQQLNTLCWQNRFFSHYFAQHTDCCVGCCIIEMRRLQAESKQAEANALKTEWLKRVATTEMPEHTNTFFDKYWRESKSGAPCN